LVSAELDRPDLDDGVTVGIETGGLQVESYVGSGHISSFLASSKAAEGLYRSVGHEARNEGEGFSKRNKSGKSTPKNRLRMLRK
jgi:hypothetical protein